MTTKDIEVIPVEQSSSEMPSRVNAKVKSNSSSNVHDLKNQSIAKGTLSMIREGRRTRNMSITYDVSTARKIRIAKYTACLLFLLKFMSIFVRSRIFYSIPFSIRLFIAFAVFTSMVIVTGVLIVYFTSTKSSRMLYAFIIFFFNRGLTKKLRSILSLFRHRISN
jgi:hypothetical protein